MSASGSSLRIEINGHPSGDPSMLMLVPLFEDGPGPSGTEPTGLRAALAANGLRGRAGEFAAVPDGVGASSFTGILGLGTCRDFNPDVVRNAVQAVVHRVPEASGFGFDLDDFPGDVRTNAAAIVEGVALGRYVAGPDRTEFSETIVVNLNAPTEGAAEVERSAAHGATVASATNWARTLVDGPPNVVTPRALADAGRGLAERHDGLDCQVLEGDALLQGGFGGIVAVGAASANPPCLIELRHRGSTSDRWYALTGKGVTFDSGGLGLKPLDRMIDMKRDMAGAAAVLAVMRAVAELHLDINVIAAIPCAENVVGSGGYRPGDVIRHRNGKTSEVISPDAEGRLILADALAYLAESNPSSLIDLATLTSAILGNEVSPVFGTDAELVSALIDAGRSAGEPLWELPLVGSCRPSLDSDVADLRNIELGTSYGTVLGALYLREFVGHVPWAHVDIVGPAYHRQSTGPWPAGATGVGTRTVVNYLERRAVIDAGMA